MAHLRIEYSAGLEKKVDLSSVCKKLSDVMVKTKIFPGHMHVEKEKLMKIRLKKLFFSLVTQTIFSFFNFNFSKI